ncbi:MAG: hypothetical protein JWQ90_730 [Hydrocarboniphaga sp.]|uniref:sensor histidine kinase n=1 Tax=Hydrocarboniphaga sp. TaxID=2033016 RepID=UPI00260BFBD5|nr:histidine kinase [Hydrocarboniphaga sp.]MDB5968280.1 hypothetical protein [Hydrocarboniphaga sp.]
MVGPESRRVRRITQTLLVVLGAIWALLWTLMSLIENPRYLHDPGESSWQPWVVAATSAATAIGWLTFWIFSDQTGRISLASPLNWFLRSLKPLPVLVPACIVVVYGLRHAVFALAGADYWHIEWTPLLRYEAIKISLFYVLWLGLAFGVRTFSGWQEQAERLLGLQKALAEAQLAQLRAQLRPHFLFNTLNTISSLMQVDVNRADRLLARLGDLLRASLSVSERDTVPLNEELDFLRLYADIMRERFEERVVLRWDIADDALGVHVPAMILQPLVENAYRYGVEANSDAQSITIRAWCDRGALIVTIHNTSSTLAGQGHDGVGLRNCRERLLRLYGESAALTLTEDAAGGVLASLSMPRAAQ